MVVDHSQKSIDAAAVSKMRKWIAVMKQNHNEVNVDTNLIKEGILDSLEMVSFILYVEELRCQEIPEALIQPQYFASLRVISDTFFSDDG